MLNLGQEILEKTAVLFTLNSAYNEKKYAEILLCYRWLFVKGNVFISERGVFGAEVFLHYRRFFVKSDFIIGGVECILIIIYVNLCNCLLSPRPGGSNLHLYLNLHMYLYNVYLVFSHLHLPWGCFVHP